MAIEPIQRYCESGEKVPCWKTVGVAFGLRISYHRTPTLLPAVTEWLTTSDSWSPKFRYASRNISRSPRESSCCIVPGWGMHVPRPQASLKDATGIAVGPVKVEFERSEEHTSELQSRL